MTAPPRGVALLAAVLVVALASVLIAGLLDRGALGSARALQAARSQQAQAFQLGLELWAGRLLRDDLDRDRVDSRGDAWSQPLAPILLPEGRIHGRLRELDGCLNLNGLWRDGQVDALTRQRFERLFAVLDLDPRLLDALVDWLDPDDRSGSGGAEDAAYAALDPPRRAGNGRFVHVSELRAVAGVDATVYAQLAPHVCAHPDPGQPLNLNTATVPVLRSLHPAIGPALAQRLHQDGLARFGSVEAFAQRLAEDSPEPLAAAGLGVASHWFVAEADILLAEVPVRLYSLIERDAQGQLHVRARSQGRY